MNPKLERWLTAERGATASAKGMPLILLGAGLAVGYQALSHRPFSMVTSLPLMALPQCLKLLAAICLLGWRKAAIPQDLQDSTIMFWVAIAGTILAVGVVVALAAMGLVALVAR